RGKITPEQFWLMKRLKHFGKLTIGELAEGLGITSSSASTAVKRLEKIGMVQRDRQKQDERVVTVELTPAGLEALQRWAEEQRSALAELLSPLTLEERSLLLQLVEKLNRNES
ncbi:MAG: MarR family winged helix-turn-helix transcriptional regulator, partial [Thermacetogeniaceae bacterium]